jgi:asparagine synthetase B (glutamine-hydrolysing)
MRHSWILAVTAEPEAISTRLPAGRTIMRRPLADGRTILVAATPDVGLCEEGGRISIDPMSAASICSIETASGETHACRGIVGIPEVYWTGDAGNLLLGSSLAELLPLVSSRRLLEPSIVDHHLFRWLPGSRTYLDGVFRLMPGHELRWSGKGPATTRQLQKLCDLASDEHRPVNKDSVALQIEALRRSVARHLEKTRDGDIAVLLSGGIDSSILQMVVEGLQGASPLQTRSFTVETPEFQGDIDYCREAVRIFGTQHAYTRIRPAEFPALVIDSIAMIGRPFGHDSLPGFPALFRGLGSADPTTFLGGEAADSIYGNFTARLVRPRYGFLPVPVLWAIGTILRPIAPDRAHGAFATIHATRGLRDETGPSHPANSLSRYCDIDMVTRWFGEKTVKRAMTERRELMSLFAGPMSEIERVHMGALFTSSLMTASIELQFGAAAGCTVLHPFVDEGVIRAALRVDADQRYFYRGETKPMLKLALEQRTGPQFTRRPKRDGGFSHDLFGWMRDGVMADMTRSIERPGFVDAKSFQQKLEQPDWTTWNLLLMDLYTKHLRSVAAVNR